MELRSKALGFGLLSVLVLTNGCWVEVNEDDHKDKSDPSSSCAKSDNSCSANESGLTEEDGKKNEFGFLPNCKNEECEVVNVGIYYELDQDLQENRTVIVEAYKNSRFYGNPVASSWKSRFNTVDSRDITTQIYLAPGVYYLRAYLTKPGDTPRPNSYRRMGLANKTPTGVFGAVSGIEQLVVTPEPTEEHYVEIVIDELYSEIPSDTGSEEVADN